MTAPARTIVAALLALAVGAAAGWWLRGRHDRAPVPAAPDRLDLHAARFADLPGWDDDHPSAALGAFVTSCAKLDADADAAPLDAHAPWAGTVGDWRPLCNEASTLAPDDDAAARDFFASRFRPWAAANGDRADDGLFTGYYEPTLHGSRSEGGRYTVPLYLRPPELVTVDLGDFRPELAGRRIAGSVVDGALRPYPDRGAIATGALAGRGLELLFVDDPIDAFFLQVQGSGRVELDDGTILRVGYAAANGRPYVAIGRELVRRGAMKLEDVTMPSIRAWLEAHPDEAPSVLAANPSYVFFRDLGADGPYGAEGVVLTPERSLAVDRHYWPLGVPMWLDTALPAEAGLGERLRRLVVAQDTGGAIVGPIRGDVFWGPGDRARDAAGAMKHRGRLWVLLPASLHAGEERISGAVGD